jgi:Leucine-rich repeat (LRR) protein
MLLFIKYDLKQERIQYNSFEEIENYDKLLYIDCSFNDLTVLPKLPHSLITFECWTNQLTELINLPNSLQKLVVQIIN